MQEPFYESFEERRKFKRIPVNFIVTYRPKEPAKLKMLVAEEEIRAAMLDLSERGMALLTAYDIPVGSLLLIEFTFIDTSVPQENLLHTMKILGEVRYNALQDARAHRLGIQFTEISENDKYIISIFCRKATLK
ncbi:MAG: PilZ domain-containing protein [Candidatus Omnitrophota bacterium]